MTWGEFKKLVKEKGVLDTDELSYIDTSFIGNEVHVEIGEDETGRDVHIY